MTFVEFYYGGNSKYLGWKYSKSPQYQIRDQFVYYKSATENYVNHCTIKERFRDTDISSVTRG